MHLGQLHPALCRVPGLAAGATAKCVFIVLLLWPIPSSSPLLLNTIGQDIDSPVDLIEAVLSGQYQGDLWSAKTAALLQDGAKTVTTNPSVKMPGIDPLWQSQRLDWKELAVGTQPNLG